MTSYLFVLGRTPALAKRELISFFPDIRFLSENIAYLPKPASDLTPVELIQIFGGTVKIAEVIDSTTSITSQTLGKILMSIGKKGAKIIFGLSSYTEDAPASQTLLEETKHELESNGISSRFVTGKNGEPLSSVVVTKQKICELILVRNEEKIMIAQTIAVQPFEEWGKRDYERPNADPKAGMLPPKVARMAVNIALGVKASGKTVLDPFCGMGTVVAEAALRGATAIGSDQSEAVISKAQENLQWLTQMYRYICVNSFKLIVSDATHISSQISANSVDAIVTEPFMGTSTIGEGKLTDANKIRDMVKGLEKLYIGCLRNWLIVLKSGGKVIIALPEFAVSEKLFFVKRVVDMCEILGYTILAGPIEYSRPQAVVKRMFYILQKKN